MRILVFISCFLISQSLVGQNEDLVYSSEGYPKITFKEQTVDLGEIREGEEVTMQFEFVNTGTEALAIEIVTACRCTSLSWPEEAIPPNGRGAIFVKFDSTGYEGEVNKVIDIISNTDPVVVEAFFKAMVVSSK